MVERQSARPAHQPYQNYTYIKISATPSWGEGTCLKDWVALQDGGKELVSIALFALATGKNVIVRVDDALPKIGDTHCQVTSLTIVQ